jgi:hypothetical protein
VSAPEEVWHFTIGPESFDAACGKNFRGTGEMMTPFWVYTTCEGCLARKDDLVRRISKGEEMVPEYKLKATQAVLRIREGELLALKGPCSQEGCPLHYAHSGPCDIK